MALVAIIFLAIIIVSIILGWGLFFKTYSKLLIAALILLLSFLVLLFFTTIHSIDVLDNAKDYSKIGPYGDYIGGILNPLIAVFAVFAAGFAFYAQYEANKQVQDQFKIQQFESQFFEMLRLHKENVNEMKITGYDSVIQETLDNEKKVVQIIRSHNTKIIEGRKVFVSMVVELISCYEFLEEINSTWKVRYTPVDLLKLSYRIFFFGSNSELIILDKIDVDFIDHVKKQLRKHRKRHRDSKANEPPRVIITSHIINQEGIELLEIKIRDNGIGLDPVFAEKIFDAFERLHSKDQYEGNGLGLALCRKIAKRHNGAITAAGEKDNGAEFTVTLPLKQSDSYL
ncbi:sensor histidine kinase [Flavobacterium johnsoniae]|uniref:histidine kinase n=1 Tax=Flavobacterium johnsoniae (strain ATCC 17061 / DSM 2064 / JCM 8514 / BCRC 14874 / CCUG 350202 / NBRC 14942 / NCIMB 11054 / UW101) TaxID=376686 RepID=A5FBL7_FLAJ1|nr:ATP-binding protein [Flavobacterium johnsoniae]ABQ07406.1 integral membrane sensor signal transduction histidine kinase [Flavobacterium johnsoniae UW101]OXE99315.1 hypothetical protein B0A63_12040 [Flavobacterium johnsoniae UW101]WQG80760.1 ATP-binding protein [Flavobacterium johnsoniae UW101]SHL14032.1 Histidine kinase-, DNA gyrase B-, and HSP90-like ATPase [Flavobacterium johnsoniae]